VATPVLVRIRILILMMIFIGVEVKSEYCGVGEVH
jgi:hypothetical protein